MLVLVITVATVISAVNGQSILIGGKYASVYQHPYQVSFQLPSGVHFCSGFLVSSVMVVTAAHCLLGLDRSKLRTYKIRAGSTLFSRGGQLVHVDRAIVHPGFNELTNDNDIALLKLASAITDGVAKIAYLPLGHYHNYTHMDLTVSGWGTVKEGNDVTPHLQVIQLKMITSSACEEIYRTKKITEKQFCVISPDKRACSADCGCPAVIGDMVYGIFSRGINCADSVYPSIYTRLSYYTEWIYRNTGIKRQRMILRKRKIIQKPKIKRRLVRKHKL